VIQSNKGLTRKIPSPKQLGAIFGVFSAFFGLVVKER